MGNQQGNRVAKPQVEPDHYIKPEYETKQRFISYWHQISEILSLHPKSILEVGIGNSFVSDYLRGRGYTVNTLDIDIRLAPDVVGSVLDQPFSNGGFDTVACFEVLEHLPYEDFSNALRELHRVSSSYVLLALPDLSRKYWIHAYLPRLGKIRRMIELPRKRPRPRAYDGEHYWNIGTRGYPLGKIESEITRAGFDLKKNYLIFEVPWHRIFVLKKQI
jgi:predicted SAM-dependent methyltransferase